jgi:hypothetical protein
VIAKLLESFDKALLALGNVVSGHTLKHLAAAVAGLVICRMLVLRTLRETEGQGTMETNGPTAIDSRLSAR